MKTVQNQKFAQHDGFQLAVRLSKADYNRIQQLVEAGLYRNFADFLRDAVHDKLGSMEIISVHEVNAKEAEVLIENYLDAHPGYNFASEIADALGLEYGITFEVIHKLLDEGRIKRAKK